jgi:hypothetical protein
MKLLILILTSFLFAITVNAQSYIGYLVDQVEIKDSLNQKIIKKGRKGDGVLVYNLDVYEGGKYKIHHINSGIDGWINRKDILLQKSVPYTAQSLDDIKKAILETEMKDPLLKLYNNTKDKISIKYGKENIELAPQEKMSLKMTKGKYYYKFKMPGVDPYYGVEVLEDHRLYDMEFYVGKSK